MEEARARMRGDDTLRANTISGRRNQMLAAYVTMLQHIHIQEQDLNLAPFKERVHLWTTIRVSHSIM